MGTLPDLIKPIKHRKQRRGSHESARIDTNLHESIQSAENTETRRAQRKTNSFLGVLRVSTLSGNEVLLFLFVQIRVNSCRFAASPYFDFGLLREDYTVFKSRFDFGVIVFEGECRHLGFGAAVEQVNLGGA